jgi:sulfatase maturation enzyme AslB (radical SAM superfamily)
MKGDEVTSVNGRFESKYLNDSESVFSALNAVSPSFCLAKWYNVSLHIPTGRTHSCYHPPTHQIPLKEIAIDVSALHNTRYKKNQRKLMLKGERPIECGFCWQIEDSGTQLSDRAYRSKDVYESGLIEEALTIENPNPRYVEVNFNQACNLKCSYCSPHLSTEWNKEIDRYGAYHLADGKTHNDTQWMISKNMIPNNSVDNPYLLAFWEWLPQIYPTLHTFRMTGGEPLMDKNTFRMFDYVKEHPSEKLHLSITSNCCPPKGQWDKFMSSLKEITDRDAINHFMLFCSLDSWGKQAEYIRNGLDFCTLYTNVTDYLKNSSKHSLTFIITFNTLSYTGFVKYIENIHKLRNEYNTDRQLIWFDIPMLNDPMWMNPKLMPNMITELERALEFMQANEECEHNRFKGFKDFEISKVQRLIDWIQKDDQFDRTTAMKNFYLFFRQHDERRGTDFLNTFPELEQFWIDCEKT